MNNSIKLQLDCEKETIKIIDFIKNCVHSKFKKSGAVVGVSGGIDSAVTLSLCIKALGKENVIAVSLPEKQSSKDSLVFARRVTDSLGCELVVKDITNALESFEVYSAANNIVKKYFMDFNDSYSFKIVLPQNLLEKDQINFYSLIVQNKNGEEVFKGRLSLQDYNSIKAATSIKLRTRMIYLYQFAEKHNKLVAGTTNRSEYELGNFCKHGDGGVDFEVISHLYKTQVYQLARHLAIPDEIIARTPSPDVFSAFVSDDEFFFSLPFNILDEALYAYTNEISSNNAANLLNLEEEKVKRLYKDFLIKQRNTYYLKELPPSISLQKASCNYAGL
ncbi:NAD(+) synthase [Pelosinus sp. IPA-1]|uniref:NAD(+) synthase n=1 Tax=Pelosinus sp. IPA-1 TaxID=3029569 RepID=UPI0024361823|nr:NAD(+) synthase [Pelosinus sp. IPA-1]GMA98535.1 NAD(+) synthase [Pelosinus sp. IPA-1]